MTVSDGRKPQRLCHTEQRQGGQERRASKIYVGVFPFPIPMTAKGERMRFRSAHSPRPTTPYSPPQCFLTW